MHKLQFRPNLLLSFRVELELVLSAGGCPLVRQHLLHHREVLVEDLLHVSDPAFQFADRHDGILLNGCLRLRRAELDVFAWATLGPQILVGKLLEVVVGSASLVILELVGVPVLDRRVAPDTDFVAQRLSFGSAIHVGDDSLRRILELFDQLVPSGLQGLAMASPWRQELYEDLLACGDLVPIVGGELEALCSERDGDQGGDFQGGHRCARS